MNTFFSISMPVHNAEKYLDEAIQSIINQDYDNYEIVLIDDSSTDSSFSICEKWKELYPDKITVKKNYKKGSLCARRECIHNSKGDFLYIMDSDDYLVNESALSRWDEVIRDKQCDLLIFNKGDQSKMLFKNTPYEEGKVIEGKDLVVLYESICTTDELNVLWDKVFSKELIDEDDDIYFANSFLSHATDFYQSIAIVSNAKHVSYINESFYYYRKTPGSITHKYNPDMLKSAQAIIERRKSIPDEWKYRPKDLRSKLDERALNEYCTVINKLEKASIEEIEKINIIKEIGSCKSFLDAYTAKKRLPMHKRIVVTLIYLKLFRLLLFLLKAFNR